MKRTVAVAAAILVAAACADQTRSLLSPADPAAGREAGKYIVVLREDALPGLAAGAAEPQAIEGFAQRRGVAPRRVFGALGGFAAELTPAQVERLKADPRVAYVEADAPVRLMTTQLFPTWGIDRIDELDLPRSNTYTYTNTGAGVNVYVLDTGVRRTHKQLYPRAYYINNGLGGNFVGDAYPNAEDCHGHGTHVAGTIAGSGYGVAKRAIIHAGRVVNCSGGGNASMVIAGMDWIIQNGSKPGVVNMSLGYGNVQSVRDMADRLAAAGYFVVAAAGNGNYLGTPQDACLESPAGALRIVTVGATDSLDREASFSNYGPCVDILAPGVAVRSAWMSNDSAYANDTGTSMAAPHVAGVGAQYLQTSPTATPGQVRAAILNNATLFTITLHSTSASNGTPNRFLFTNY
jgi:subtilisin family serine protease